MDKIGVIDTMFARVDMGAIAATTLAGLPGHGERFEVPSTCWYSSTSPVGRCRRLIEDVTGAAVSAGFIHSCLAKAAEAIADVVKLIKTLIIAAYVAGFDETTLRAGPAGTKRYVLLR